MLTYKRQILLPLAIASLMLTCALAALFFAAYHLVKANILDDKVESIRYQIISLQNAISRAETGQRGYLLTNNISFVHNFESGKADIDEIYGKLPKQLEYFPELRPLFFKVRQLLHAKLKGMDASIQIQMGSGAYSPHLNSAGMGINLMYQIDIELKLADDHLRSQKNDIHRQIERSLRQVVGGAVILVAVIIMLLFAGYRRTIQLFEIAVDSRNAAEEYSHDAYHDALTGLPNRRYFETHLKRMLSLGKRNHQVFALLYLDLDGFKLINDQHGHEAGDEALKHAAGRFKSALRESDFLARLGGDEFAVIIEQYYNDSELTGLTSRILRYINQPFTVLGHASKLGVSIGISRFPSDGHTAEALMKAADGAMYQAKRSGKDRAIFATGRLGWP